MKYVKSKYTLWEDEVRKTIIKGYKIERRWYTLYENGELHIKAGYSWDGATGGIDTEDFVLPSLEHDIICELINEGALPPHYQALGEEQLRITAKMQEHSMPWIRRMWVYFAVRFYQMNKKNKSTRKILEIK